MLNKSNTNTTMEEDDGTEEEVNHETVERINMIEEKITTNLAKADGLMEKCGEHSNTTLYGHYIQLQIGLDSFQDALAKFLKEKCKRPRGLLEFMFNNSIKQLGVGEFIAEHSGYEQTNGRALNTLKNFKAIDAAQIAAYDETHPSHGKIKERFTLYEELAEKLHALAVRMKSQARIDHDEFDNTVLDLTFVWNKVFPEVPYFNKLHFIMMHYPEFVC